MAEELRIAIIVSLIIGVLSCIIVMWIAIYLFMFERTEDKPIQDPNFCEMINRVKETKV